MAKIEQVSLAENGKRIRTLRIMQILFVLLELGAALLFAVVLPAIGYHMAPIIQTTVVVSFIVSAIVVYFVVGSIIKKAASTR